MRSSTSSFRAPPEWWALRILPAFLGSFLCMALLGATLPADSKMVRPGDRTVTGRDGEWIATPFGGDEELFYGYPEFYQAMADADIWLLGNSQVQYALRRDEMRAFTTRWGLEYFNFGITNMSGEQLTLRLMRKYDLWPALVVINLDDFFTGELSPRARKIISESWKEKRATLGGRVRMTWEERRQAFEARAALLVTSHLGLILPFWRASRPMLDVSPPIYRSSIDGSWKELPPVRSFGKPGPISYAMMQDGGVVPKAHLKAAAEFVEEVRSHGVEVVLTVLPHRGGSVPRARRIARAVDAPLLLPEVGDLETLDSVHLDAASAARFGQAFLEELSRTAELQRVLDARAPGKR